jgi:hypothetical protein
MMGVLIVTAFLLVVFVGSELALRGTRLQTGLSRVLVVWTVVYLAAVYPVWHYGGTGLVPLTIFWGGAFLSWFGVRSHIESSILLRMLYLLRRGPTTESGLVSEYTSQYGEAMRIDELLRGGLAAKSGDRMSVTPKGKTILAVVSKLG